MPDTRGLKILLVVDYFPPLSGGGRAYRAAKLVRRWTEAGCRVAVLCSDRSMDPDAAMLEGIDPDRLEVLRSPQPSASRWSAWLHAAAAQLSLMDAQWGLVYRMLDTLLKHPISFIPDVVVTSSAPYEVHWVGYWLKRLYGFTWVTDWRDPFSLNRNYNKRIPIGRFCDRRAESFLYRHCDGVIFNTIANREQSARAFDFDPSVEKYTVCQNGFDRADLPPAGGARESGEQIVISYIGGVRGNAEECRFVARVVAAAGALRERGVVIRFIGNNSEIHAAEAAKSAGLIELVGFVSQSELRPYWEQSDALLVFLPPSDEFLGWVPQKIYPYLASGRTILGFVPKGEAMDYLSAAGGNVLRDPVEYDVVSTIDAVIEAVRNDADETVSPHSLEAVSRFDQERLFADLLEWLKERADL